MLKYIYSIFIKRKKLLGKAGCLMNSIKKDKVIKGLHSLLNLIKKDKVIITELDQKEGKFFTKPKISYIELFV